MKDNSFTVFAAIGLLLLAMTAQSHWRGGNTGVLLLVFWTALATLVFFVNSIVWWSDVDIRAPGWCDITVKIYEGATMGGPCAALCVLRRLESIASTRAVHITDSDKRRRLWQDLALGCAVPVVYMVVNIVNQGHSFDLVESYGCVPEYYRSWLYIVFTRLPPVLVSLTALVYAVLCLRWFTIRRRQFAAVLQSSGTGIDKSRYVRLMALASLELLWTLPINLVVFVADIFNGAPLLPYTNWADVHYGFFTRIDQYPAAFWDAYPHSFRVLDLARWAMPVNCFLIFIFFGTTREARSGYLHIFRMLLAKLGVRTAGRGQKSRVSDRLQVNALPRVRSSDSFPAGPNLYNADKDDEEKSIALTPRTPSFGCANQQELSHDVRPSACPPSSQQCQFRPEWGAPDSNPGNIGDRPRGYSSELYPTQDGVAITVDRIVVG